MNDSFAQFAITCPDHHVPLIRELMSYDALCEISNPLPRDEFGKLYIEFGPAPLHWSRQIEFPWCLINADLRPEHEVLDVGGSWSVFKFALAKRCRKVTVLELDPDAIAKSAKTIEAFGIGHKIAQVQGDARNPPFPDETFDRIYMLSVLEHVPTDRFKCLDEMKRVLKPGGMLLLTLDMVVNGSPCGEFNVDAAEGLNILKHLGIPGVIGNPNDRPAVVWMEKEDVKLAVLMIRWVKPLENEK